MFNHSAEQATGAAAGVVAVLPALSPRPVSPATSPVGLDEGIDAPDDGIAALRAPARETGRVRAPAVGARRPVTPTDRAHVVRARCLAFGGLASLLTAVGIIATTTLRATKPPAVRPALKVAVAPRYWIVRPGQTLISIAAREGISPSAVARANPSLVGKSLASGQRVRLR